MERLIETLFVRSGVSTLVHLCQASVLAVALSSLLCASLPALSVSRFAISFKRFAGNPLLSASVMLFIITLDVEFLKRVLLKCYI